MSILAQSEEGHGVRLRGLAADVGPAGRVGEALVNAVLLSPAIRLVSVTRLVLGGPGPVGVTGNTVTRRPSVGSYISNNDNTG